MRCSVFVQFFYTGAKSLVVNAYIGKYIHTGGIEKYVRLPTGSAITKRSGSLSTQTRPLSVWFTFLQFGRLSLLFRTFIHDVTAQTPSDPESRSDERTTAVHVSQHSNPVPRHGAFVQFRRNAETVMSLMSALIGTSCMVLDTVGDTVGGVALCQWGSLMADTDTAPGLSHASEERYSAARSRRCVAD